MEKSCEDPLDGTCIYLSGDTRHIVEGFSVPCFFALLEERMIDYSLEAFLFGTLPVLRIGAASVSPCTFPCCMHTQS